MAELKSSNEDLLNEARAERDGLLKDARMIKDKMITEAKDEAKAALNQKYEALIAVADQSFGSKEYEAAQNKYSEASALKSTEQYPKDKIAEIELAPPAFQFVNDT